MMTAMLEVLVDPGGAFATSSIQFQSMTTRLGQSTCIKANCRSASAVRAAPLMHEQGVSRRRVVAGALVAPSLWLPGRSMAATPSGRVRLGKGESGLLVPEMGVGTFYSTRLCLFLCVCALHKTGGVCGAGGQ